MKRDELRDMGLSDEQDAIFQSRCSVQNIEWRNLHETRRITRYGII
nr:MAG TPA: protein of unknown function (DUF1127) [Caudoviricetes sp.]